MNLPDGVSHDAGLQLQLYSDYANRNATHPLDRRRWFDFILAAHQERAELDVENLEAWLVEQGWQLPDAERLVLQYEFGRGLLKRAEEAQQE